jgi:hypothetical protein
MKEFKAIRRRSRLGSASPVAVELIRCSLVAIMCAIACATGSLPALAGDQVVEGQRSFDIYGFAMGDVIQDSKRVDPNWESAFRPSKIGVDGQFGTNGQTDVSVKQSRFGVKGTTPTAVGPIDFKFEFDFFGVGADEGQTTIRLRHFYFEWKELLVGQTHSLFMDIDVFPDVIDYWGPSGLVFWRHPQVRWTPYKTETSQFAIAAEQPLNNIDPGNIRLFDEFSETEVQNDEKTPDLTAQFREEQDWGHIQIAAILRRVGYQYQITPDEPWIAGYEIGWGVNLSASLKLADKDKLLLQVVHGDGIASYMNDGGMDLAPTVEVNPLTLNAALKAEAVPLTGISAYYNHYWTSKWESAFGYSLTEVSNTNFQTPTVFHKGQYASINLLAYPIEELMIGGEFLWGKLTQNNGETGDDLRFQFSAKYSFDMKL